MPCSDIIVIVMAAGQSSRFGSDKRVAKLGNGETLLSSTLRTIQKTFSNSRVVIKPEDNAQSLGLTPTNHIIISQRSHLGLGYSISDAFRQLCSDESIHHYRAAAVWLADLPWVSEETCGVLTKMATPGSIVQPIHQENPGHPVVFGREFWHELALLENDRGASPVIKKHSKRVIYVSLNDPGVCTDVDYPDDLTKSQKIQEARKCIQDYNKNHNKNYIKS
ncbi:nucleotidyltransferase family protein [Halomonas sp. IOP_14]|uniref:nucleotidyltransferase family protein n=1 Tax=Halomonadaceae TaxID=28256 RepID=UPI00114472A3|nr:MULTISPECIES: nucleotidyltransferase family protein [Halomonas]MCD1586040.1 nucleotidyltransferase family protein [Halomonas sp. IOP_14]